MAEPLCSASSSKTTALHEDSQRGLDPVAFLFALAQEDDVFEDPNFDLENAMRLSESDLPRGGRLVLKIKADKRRIPVLRAIVGNRGNVTVDPEKGWQQAEAASALRRAGRAAWFIGESACWVQPSSCRHFLTPSIHSLLSSPQLTLTLGSALAWPLGPKTM